MTVQEARRLDPLVISIEVATLAFALWYGFAIVAAITGAVLGAHLTMRYMVDPLLEIVREFIER